MLLFPLCLKLSMLDAWFSGVMGAGLTVAVDCGEATPNVVSDDDCTGLRLMILDNPMSCMRSRYDVLCLTRNVCRRVPAAGPLCHNLVLFMSCLSKLPPQLFVALKVGCPPLMNVGDIRW